jgi:hypothetical protein
MRTIACFEPAKGDPPLVRFDRWSLLLCAMFRLCRSAERGNRQLDLGV